MDIVKDLFNHPYSFAVGIGVANGALAVSRNKPIDVPTAITLSVILGLGEMCIVMYEPEHERHHSLAAVGIYSVLGVLTGVLPFVTPGAHGGGGLPIAQKEAVPAFANNGSAVSGWSRQGRRVASRRRG